MLGWNCANRARSVEFNFDDERHAVCLGHGRWFLYELESDIDSEQHTTASNGARYGGALTVDVRARAAWCPNCWSDCASSSFCSVDIFSYWFADAHDSGLFLGR